jgi:hypothetical protein
LIERLRAGLAWGFEAPAVELFTDLTADQHIAYERTWIKALGRRDLGTGRLYNLNDGPPEDDAPMRSWRPLPASMLVTPMLRKRNPMLVSRVRTHAEPRSNMNHQPSPWIKSVAISPVSIEQRKLTNTELASRFRAHFNISTSPIKAKPSKVRPKLFFKPFRRP